MDGNTEGLWVFDSETLEQEAVVEAVEGQTIQGVVMSSKSGRWYLSWSEGSTLEGTHRDVLAALDPSTGRIVERATFSDRSVAGPLVYEPTRNEIVAYGSGSFGARFFDAETLELNRQHPIGPTDSVEVLAAVVDTERGKIYFGVSRFGKTRKVRVYDVGEQTVVRSFRPTADPALRGSGVTDLALSPGGRFLYTTTYSLDTGGAFSAVDLEAGEVVAEHPAGSYANLAVHPNGRSVYVDCPAGGWRGLIPTKRVLRYNVEARKVEVFIDGAEGRGVKGLGSDAALVATHITALSDDQGIVMVVSGPTRDGEDVHMVRVDRETGKALSTYSLPRDERGYLRATITDLQLSSGPGGK
ncbi:hypothetical protein CRI93_05465 [Longimonas halophila]|uniref:YncE family protein n=1 Tax=Longimonas halophila TaxID=1469170 RepID=A0A2H3P867_9BACT|nr:hypothetical protein [Longimonas halophila]PEN07895.1 hypothetical protein CRI93_05465 [Longimonas halophila]